MALELTKLAAQGRAYSGARPWHQEELAALLMLERERNLARTEAAEFVRNGILSIEAYDAAKAAEFVPKTLVEAQDELEQTLKNSGAAYAAKPVAHSKPKTSKKGK